MFVQNFNLLGLIVPKKIPQKFLMLDNWRERKMKKKNKKQKDE